MKMLARDIVGECLLRIGLTNPSRSDVRRLNIVTFHRVLPEELRREYPFPGLVVTPDELRWFVDYFRRSYECRTLAAACDRWRARQFGERPLMAITFDDGQVDNLTRAEPVLHDAGVQATFFVTLQGIQQDGPLWHDRIAYAVARVDRCALASILVKYGLVPPLANTSRFVVARNVTSQAKNLPSRKLVEFAASIEALAGESVVPAWDGLMNVEQVDLLKQRGHEIGCHTATHALLTNCTDEELENEVAGSRAALESAVGGDIQSFCYPNGNHDQRTCDSVRRAGFEQAVTTKWGSNSPAADPYRLRRFDMVATHVRSRHGRLSPARLAWRMSGLRSGVLGQ